MKQRLTIIGLLLCFVASGFARAGYAQSNENDPNEAKVVVYLGSYLAREAERPSSLRNRFVAFEPIDPELTHSLTATFTKHRFYVAKTFYSHWMKDDGVANILVVTNAQTGDVIGHQWALWFSGETETFRHLLESYTAQSSADALAKVILLSKLIVSLYPGKVGEVKIDKGKITADLYWGSDVWRVLTVKLDQQNRFGPMAFVNPKAERTN